MKRCTLRFDYSHLAEASDLVAADGHAVAISLDIWIPPMDTVVLHHVSAVFSVDKRIIDACTLQMSQLRRLQPPVELVSQNLHMFALRNI